MPHRWHAVFRESDVCVSSYLKKNQVARTNSNKIAGYIFKKRKEKASALREKNNYSNRNNLVFFGVNHIFVGTPMIYSWLYN